jgi:arylsulfatase A-like enzyme
LTAGGVLGSTVLFLIGVPTCGRDPSISRDLLEELHQAEIIQETRLLDLGVAEARPHLGRGWSVDETVPAPASHSGDTSFVWAVGDASELVFHVLDPRPLLLHLAVRPLWYPQAGPLELEVELNGRPLATESLSQGDRLMSFELSASALVLGENRLRLIPSRAPVAAEVIPGSGELRRLSVAVFFLALGAGCEDLDAVTAGRFGRSASAAPAAPPDSQSDADRHRPNEFPSAALAPPREGPLQLRDSTQVSWQLHVRRDTRLQYAVELVSGSDAIVKLEWVPGPEALEVARHELSASWLGRRAASGSSMLQPGSGTLRLRAACLPEHSPCEIVLRTARLHFPPPPRPWHVVWITLDTFRADHLGSAGRPDVRTPHLDRLARAGATFSDVLAQIPITGPAHTSLFTGRYPLTTGVRNNGQMQPPQEETIAEILKGNGWETAAVVSLAVLHSSLHFDQGFDRFIDCTGAPWWRTAPEVTDRALDLLDRQWPERPVFLWVHYSDPHEPYAAPGATGAALDLVLNGQPLATYDSGSGRLFSRQVRMEPGLNRLQLQVRPQQGRTSQGALIRYLAFDSPLARLRYAQGFRGPNANGLYHLDKAGTVEVESSSRQAVDVLLSMWAMEELPVPESRRRYAEEVELVDSEIGRLVQALVERGMIERTLILVTNDHGEGLWDHRRPGHVEQLYEESLQSPFILRMPQFIRPRLRQVPGEHVDLVPTLLELLGLPPKPDAQGRSLASLLHGAEGEPLGAPAAGLLHRDRFLQTFRPEASAERRALVRDGWKLIVSETTGRRELYHLPSDPGEQQDLGPQRPELVASMEARLAALEAATTGTTAPAPEASAAEIERMKALGYAH